MSAPLNQEVLDLMVRDRQEGLGYRAIAARYGYAYSGWIVRKIRQVDRFAKSVWLECDVCAKSFRTTRGRDWDHGQRRFCSAACEARARRARRKENSHGKEPD